MFFTVIEHYNKFPNLGVYPTNFPNLKGPRAPSQTCKKKSLHDPPQYNADLDIGVRTHFITGSLEYIFNISTSLYQWFCVSIL